MNMTTARVVAAVVATTLLAFGASANTKKRVFKDVYDDNGVVPFAVEMDGEIYILVAEDKARKAEGELSECRLKLPYQTQIIEQQGVAIGKLQELSELRKADLAVCVADRREAYQQLSSIAKQERPFFEKPQINQALGFVACAATFAVWQWSDK